MKKILLILLLANALYSDAKFYVGTGVGLFNEKFEDKAYKSKTYDHAKFKVGYGDIDAYAVEFSLDYTKKDAKSNIYNQTQSYGLSVELLKAFNLNTFANPYMKAGFGFGYFETKAPDSSIIHYGDFTLGTGIFVPFGEHLDLQLGYEYKSISYENTNTVNSNSTINSHANIGYMGINIRF